MAANFKRFSLAVAFQRDGEIILLGAADKPSKLNHLLDEVDPEEVACAGILKDLRLDNKRTYPTTY